MIFIDDLILSSTLVYHWTILSIFSKALELLNEILRPLKYFCRFWKFGELSFFPPTQISRFCASFWNQLLLRSLWFQCPDENNSLFHPFCEMKLFGLKIGIFRKRMGQMYKKVNTIFKWIQFEVFFGWYTTNF